ncbi:AAA family ATPase [Actinomadura hibisca]|uniref:AAA family ATPase n=1 Tax=Actinomadura hibisca TaxID=68565 RepID=UPI00082A40E0|nr:AAA family ATPase [Actinomadura hibisca]
MTIIYEPQPAAAERLVALLAGLPGDLRTAAAPAELAALLDADPAEALVVAGPGTPPADALAFAADQRLARPWTGVVLLSPEADADLLRAALRSGVREVADPRDPVALHEACARALQLSLRLVPASVPAAGVGVGVVDGGDDGRIVTVLGTKGGCGKTALATNLAVTLARTARRGVLLVDLDVQAGDVAAALRLAPERGLGDAVGLAGGLDEAGLASLLTPVWPGLRALTAPGRPAEGDRVDGELVGEVLALARRTFDHVVVDTPAHFCDPLLAALDATDRCLVVTAPDVLTLNNTRVALETLDLLGHPAEQRIVVLNRANSPVGLTIRDVERVLGAPVGPHVPSSADVPASLNRGVPIAVDKPGHPVSRAIADLAASALGVAQPPAPSRVSRWRGWARRSAHE